MYLLHLNKDLYIMYKENIQDNLSLKNIQF